MRASAASCTSLPLPLAWDARSGETRMRWPLRPASSERREAASLSVRRRPPDEWGLSLAAAEAAASLLWETLRSADSRGGPRPRENGDSPGAEMRLGEPEDERRRSCRHKIKSYRTSNRAAEEEGLPQRHSTRNATNPTSLYSGKAELKLATFIWRFSC